MFFVRNWTYLVFVSYDHVVSSMVYVIFVLINITLRRQIERPNRVDKLCLDKVHPG